MAKQFAHIEIKPLEKRPENWTDPKAWPSTGLYAAENDSGWLSLVTADGVTILYSGLPNGVVINENTGIPDSINETLLLKVIAAASRAETLKGV